MKPRQLPQPVLSRWLDLEERVAVLQQEALAADSEVARLRTLMSSGTTDTTPEEFNAAKADFPAVYDRALSLREHAQQQCALKARIKSWIESLPSNTKLALVTPSTVGVVRDQLRDEIISLRSELA